MGCALSTARLNEAQCALVVDEFRQLCPEDASEAVQASVQASVQAAARGESTSLDFSSLALVGVVPESIGLLRRLVNVNVATNAISGLPDAICGLPALATIMAHENKIESLPADLGRLGRTLLVLDLFGKGHNIEHRRQGVHPAGSNSYRHVNE